MNVHLTDEEVDAIIVHLRAAIRHHPPEETLPAVTAVRKLIGLKAKRFRCEERNEKSSIDF